MEDKAIAGGYSLILTSLFSGAYTIEKFHLVVGLELESLLKLREIAIEIILDVFKAKDTIRGIRTEGIDTILIGKGIANIEIGLEEGNKVRLTNTSHAILVSYFERIASRGKELLASLGIIDRSPRGVAIIIDDLHFGLVSVVGRSRTESESYTVGYLNAIRDFRVSAYNKGNSGKAAIIIRASVFRLRLGLIAQQLIELSLSGVDCEDIGAAQTNVTLEIRAFGGLFGLANGKERIT